MIPVEKICSHAIVRMCFFSSFSSSASIQCMPSMLCYSATPTPYGYYTSVLSLFICVQAQSDHPDFNCTNESIHYSRISCLNAAHISMLQANRIAKQKCSKQLVLYAYLHQMHFQVRFLDRRMFLLLLLLQLYKRSLPKKIVGCLTVIIQLRLDSKIYQQQNVFFAIVMCTTCTMHMYEILMESFSFCYSLQLIVVVVSLRLLPFLSIFFFLVFFIPSNNASIAFSIFSLKLELHMIEDGRMHFAK